MTHFKRLYQTISIRVICLLAFTMVVGCNPCKRLTRLCPPVIKDSISYIRTTKLDTIKIQVPGDTTYIEVPVASLDDVNILEDNTNQRVELKVKDGVLRLKTICKEDSLQVVITELETKLSETRTEIVKVPEPYPEKYVPKIYKWALVICILGLVVLILWIVMRIKNKTIKTVLDSIRGG